MGFSLVAAFGIISISVIIGLQIFTATVIPSISETHTSFIHCVNRGMNKIQTDISISNVVIVENGPNYNHIVSVKNIGSTTLSTAQCSIVLNGVVYPHSCPEAYLYPQQTVEFTLEDIPGAGIQRLKVITDYGIADYYEYTIV
ncbi:MAG: hypothetical protein QXL17_03640 [Candidatus Thermoplasmatota archaeon]